jgi:hypothetical protein
MALEHFSHIFHDLTVNLYCILYYADINECSTMFRPCGPYSICSDTDGDRICKCNFFRKGDGKSEKGCDQLILPYYAIIVIGEVH